MRSLVIAIFIAAAATSGSAAAETFGKIDFPVTGSKSAQEHFLHGVMALHSFFYDEPD